MHTRHLPLLAPVLALALAACGGGRRAATPTATLPRPTDTIATTLAEATGAAWLGGARYAVVSPFDTAVTIVDFAARRTTRLGDPARIAAPTALFANLDTIYVDDPGLRQVSVWTADGRLRTTIPAPDATRGALPQARDAAGQLYTEVAPPPGIGGAGNRDSAAVVRTPADFRRADTVARLAPLDLAQVEGEQGRRFVRRIFSGQDRWDALRDGTIWVARVYQNRVDWIGRDGKVTKGDALPDRVLEVTRADREVFTRRFPPDLRQDVERLPFSPIKPPFEAGFTAADGRVWLEKSRAIADSTQRYQVVDRAGKLVVELHLVGHGRILAVARDGTALVAEPTREGTAFMRVRVPADTSAVAR